MRKKIIKFDYINWDIKILLWKEQKLYFSLNRLISTLKFDDWRKHWFYFHEFTCHGIFSLWKGVVEIKP